MNTYIILAAGKGANLHPLTLKYPKTSYKLDEETTVLQRMVKSIRKLDRDAVVVALGIGWALQPASMPQASMAVMLTSPLTS